MTKLNKVILRLNGYTIKAVQFTEPTKEQMLAINKDLGAQVFQEKYIDQIIEGYNDGDELIPLFYKDGGFSCIELYDWLYVRNGEVYATGDFNNIRNVAVEIRNEIEEMSKETNNEYTSEIVCPYCGYENKDSCEDQIIGGEIESCPKCSLLFKVFRHVEVTYSTQKQIK